MLVLHKRVLLYLLPPLSLLFPFQFMLSSLANPEIQSCAVYISPVPDHEKLVPSSLDGEAI
jgi:hypothetical protein